MHENRVVALRQPDKIDDPLTEILRTALEIAGELAWAVNRRMGRIQWLLSGIVSRNPRRRLDISTRIFRRFPFGPSAYVWKSKPASDGILALDCLRCPVAEHFSKVGLGDLCVRTFGYLEAVTAARATATSVKVDASTITDPATFKKFQDAQAQLSESHGRLLAISENYPDLKSNQNYLALQSQLEVSENRIALARHIEAVRVYNTELKTFPVWLWARLFYSSNKHVGEFTVADSAKTVPAVKF